MPVTDVLRRRRWNPGMGAAIDWTHPLAKGLAYCLVPVGNGRVFDLVSRRFLTSQSGATGGSSTFGAANRQTASKTGAYLNLASPPQYPLSFTWAGSVIGATTWESGGMHVVYYADATNWANEVSTEVATAGHYGIDWYNPGVSTWGIARISGATWAGWVAGTSAFVHGAATVTIQTGDQKLYVNGAQEASAATALSQPTAAGAGVALCLGCYSVPRNTNSAPSLGLMHTRILSAREVAQLHLDPFCFLLPQRREIEVLGVASNQGTISITGWMPRIAVDMTNPASLPAWVDVPAVHPPPAAVLVAAPLTDIWQPLTLPASLQLRFQLQTVGQLKVLFGQGRVPSTFTIETRVSRSSAWVHRLTVTGQSTAGLTPKYDTPSSCVYTSPSLGVQATEVRLRFHEAEGGLGVALYGVYAEFL